MEAKPNSGVREELDLLPRVLAAAIRCKAARIGPGGEGGGEEREGSGHHSSLPPAKVSPAPQKVPNLLPASPRDEMLLPAGNARGGPYPP